MAVYTESRLGRKGRLRNNLLRAQLRLMAHAGDAWTLDDATHASRRPPGGGYGHFWGTFFISWLVKKRGEDVLADLSDDYGSRSVPYAYQRSFGQGARAHLSRAWEEFLAEEKAAADALERTIAHRGGPPPTRRLTRIGAALGQPRFSPQGDLLVALNAPDFHPGIYRIDVSAKRAPTLKAVVRTNGAADLLPLEDGEVVFSQLEVFNNFWVYRDLFRHRPAHPIEQVTHGKRLRAPDARGDLVVAEEQSAESSAIVRLGPGGETFPLVKLDDGSHLTRPRLSPDGSRMVFTRRRLGLGREVVEMDLASGEERALTSSRHQNIDPVYSTDGGAVIFASDRDGVFNLYALRKSDGRTFRLTDTMGAAHSPEPTPDGRGVVYVDLTLAGEDLFATALSFDRPVVWDPPDAEGAGGAGAADVSSRQHHTGEAETYQPLKTLRPFRWLPVAAAEPAGTRLGVNVQGSDAVQTHSWSGEASWDFALSRPRVVGRWGVRDFLLPVDLGGDWRTIQSSAFRRNAGEPENHVETIGRLFTDVALPFSRWQRFHRLQLGLDREWRFVHTGVTSRPDERAPLYPVSEDLTALRLTWRYGDLERGREAVSSEDGQTLMVRFRLANPWVFSELDLYEATVDARIFRRIPGLPQHVVGLYLAGGFAIGERQRRANFILGGFGQRDFVADALSSVRFGSGILRGYRPFSDGGDGYMLATVEHRFPIWEVEKGHASTPAHLMRVTGALFADLGDAFFDVPDATQLKLGLGGEMRTQLRLGHNGTLLLRLGYARGLMPGGENQPYLVFGVPF
jgi:hypothetical protein